LVWKVSANCCATFARCNNKALEEYEADMRKGAQGKHMAQPTTEIEFVCAKADFVPAPFEKVRWLDQDCDYDLFRKRSFWTALGGPPSVDEWRDFHAQGYQYCAVVDGDEIVASAAVWKYSEKAWELAAVRTDEAHRRLGYAKAVCSFVTSYILKNARVATCHIREGNVAMIDLAQRLGFKKA
jgi:predicted GNAT family acetyltransferase